MNDDEAIRFINSLVKNLQVLCHGSVEFKQKVEVIGHLYLNVDSDIKFDYIVNEKVCKNEESSTTFVSNSFHAGPRKSLAERKKELEEELTKLQQEQSKQNRVAIESRRQSANNRRKVPFDSQISNQSAFNRQSPMRNDGYPLSPLPEHTFKPNLDSPVAKIPRLSFEDMHNYDINGMNSSMPIQKNSSVNDGERVFIPTSISDLAQSSLSSTEERKPNIKFDLTSIKQEHMSQSDEDSCVIDRGRTTSGKDTTSIEMYNASMASCDLNLLANINNQSRHTFKSSFDQTSQHSSNSPGTSSLGSPRGASCVQSPPSSSQGILGVEQINSQEQPYRRPSADSLFICECGKTFRTNSGYTDHKRSHDGNFRYICPICTKGCNNKQQFIGHMNKHSNNRPFKCEKCNRAFTLRHNLVRHKVTCFR